MELDFTYYSGFQTPPCQNKMFNAQVSSEINFVSVPLCHPIEGQLGARSSVEYSCAIAWHHTGCWCMFYLNYVQEQLKELGLLKYINQYFS